MSKVKHISFEEFAANPAAILDSVRADHASVVVEYASGGNVHIKPYAPPSRRRAGNERVQNAAADAAARPRQPRAELAGNPQNISSVGAVYDLDPGSITPG